MAQFVDSIEAAVDRVLDTVKGDVVLGIPLAIGKPNPFVNALYRRIKANPKRKLRIVTALSLLKPAGHSDLERHFLEPLVERLFRESILLRIAPITEQMICNFIGERVLGLPRVK